MSQRIHKSGEIQAKPFIKTASHSVQKKFEKKKGNDVTNLESHLDDLSLETSTTSILPPGLSVPLPNEPRPSTALASQFESNEQDFS